MSILEEDLNHRGFMARLKDISSFANIPPISIGEAGDVIGFPLASEGWNE